MSGVADVFQQFLQVTGVKKIVSFGGWSFSTDLDTVAIFRQGVTTGDRLAFANNVASVRLFFSPCALCYHAFPLSFERSNRLNNTVCLVCPRKQSRRCRF